MYLCLSEGQTSAGSPLNVVVAFLDQRVETDVLLHEEAS